MCPVCGSGQSCMRTGEVQGVVDVCPSIGDNPAGAGSSATKIRCRWQSNVLPYKLLFLRWAPKKLRHELSHSLSPPLRHVVLLLRHVVKSPPQISKGMQLLEEDASAVGDIGSAVGIYAGRDERSDVRLERVGEIRLLRGVDDHAAKRADDQ
ncbi:hypothetical protein PG984_002639 [Apiospora sp. TS-2023a]